MTRPMPLTLSSTVVATEEYISSPLAGEEVILDLVSGTYYGLNDVATRVWRLLASPRRIEEICDVLVLTYDVDRARLETDVLALLRDLLNHDLIRIVSS